MNNIFKMRGGAKIGKSSVSYPLASLYVDQDMLKINASMVGNLVFLPDDIVDIELHDGLLANKGIRIKHTVQKYSPEVIFYCLKNVEEVMTAIRDTGFLDKKRKRSGYDVAAVRERQGQGAQPFKKSFLIFLLVMWNVLLLMDFYFFVVNGQNPKDLAGVCSLVLFALLIVLGLLTLTSERFRGLVLKEGRQVEDVKSAVLFVLGLSLVMFISLFLVSQFAK